MTGNSTGDTKNKTTNSPLVALVALLVFFGVILCMAILMYEISQYEEASAKLDSIITRLIDIKENNKLCQHDRL
jgi:signal transduction histidine kinase